MFDIIGKIYKETGVILTDEEGFEYPETEAVDGFHVNTLPEFMTDELQQYVVKPSKLSRMVAGRSDTICLKFANEDEFNEVTGNE